MRISSNIKLAFIAFMLSFGAMVSSLIEPHINENKITSIPVLQLASQIRTHSELLLIDLQSPEDFEQFHIPTSRNLTITQTRNLEDITDQHLVVYSSNRTTSLHAALLLKKKGAEHVSILEGGVHDWYNFILYPEIPKEVGAEYHALADSIKALSAYFGGQPEFVEDKHVLKYYQNPKKSQKATLDEELVRMGC